MCPGLCNWWKINWFPVLQTGCVGRPDRVRRQGDVELSALVLLDESTKCGCVLCDGEGQSTNYEWGFFPRRERNEVLPLWPRPCWPSSWNQSDRSCPSSERLMTRWILNLSVEKLNFTTPWLARGNLLHDLFVCCTWMWACSRWWNSWQGCFTDDGKNRHGTNCMSCGIWMVWMAGQSWEVWVACCSGELKD